MTNEDVLAYRDALQKRAEACAEAGFMVHAVVWAMAADMCRAAFWTECFGPAEAERLVEFYGQGE